MTGSLLGIVAQVAIIFVSTGTVTDNYGVEKTCSSEFGALGGWYDREKDPNTVYVCETVYLFDIPRVKYHEVGHFFYYQKVPQDLRDKWDRVSLGQRKNKDFVSENAKIDASEDFAETFSYIAI